MSNASQRFQTFITRLRPHRVAILTDVKDPAWESTCLRIIEYQSQIWGGAHSIIFPTDGKAINETFWELLSSFDPDVIFCYQKTGTDLFEAAPAEFNTLVHKIAVDQGFSPDHVNKDILKSPLGPGFSISEELSRQLLRRLAPFHADGVLHVSRIDAQDAPGYPLTSVVDIIGAVDPAPSYIFDIKNDAPPTLSMPPRLWIVAESGIASKLYQERLEKKNVATVPEFLINASENDLIEMGMRPWAKFGSNSPFAISTLALKGVRATASRRYAVPSILVFGDTIEDFCLSSALSRLHGRAVWLPSWFIPSGGEYPARLISAVGKMEDRGRREHSQEFALMSKSRDLSNLRELATVLSEHITTASFSALDADAGRIRPLVEHPAVWYITKNTERITTHQVVDEKLPGTFESPVPAIFTEVNPYNHRWLVELTFEGHRTPRHPALGSHLASSPNLGEVRAAMNGVTYTCPGVAVISQDIELQLLRPSICVPSAERIFQIGFDYFGYECKISDKGSYAQGSIAKFGGLSEIAMALRHPGLFALLQRFRDVSRPKDGTCDKGVYLRDKRRYLDFNCIRTILDNTASAKDTIDDYIAKGVLYRGLVLHCKRCADLSWFSVDEITQRFTCRRCGTNQQYVQSSWRHPDEPAWFYKLDEIVFQMLNHEGHVTILALDRMRRESPLDFQFAPELEVRTSGAQKWQMEIDICCISGGQIYIGEAKTVASLKTDTKSAAKVAEKYRHLADNLVASGVIFSTTEPSWDSDAEAAIKNAFANYPHLRVRRIMGHDLYT